MYVFNVATYIAYSIIDFLAIRKRENTTVDDSVDFTFSLFKQLRLYIVLLNNTFTFDNSTKNILFKTNYPFNALC